MRNLTISKRIVSIALLTIMLLVGGVGALLQFLYSNIAYASTGDSSSGFVVCQNTNYGSPCETFYYTSHDTCIFLDQVAGHNRSVQYLGSYIGGYSAVMYHDNNCQTYLARYDNNNPDIGWGLYDQFSSMRLEQHTLPPGTQVSPPNGYTFPSGTTAVDVNFSGTAPFTLHVWDPKTG